METYVRTGPGSDAKRFGIEDCQNAEVIADKMESLKVLGIKACATCSGCGMRPDKMGCCTLTFRQSGYRFEGNIQDGWGDPRPAVIPGFVAKFPYEVPAGAAEQEAVVIPLHLDAEQHAA